VTDKVTLQWWIDHATQLEAERDMFRALYQEVLTALHETQTELHRREIQAHH